MVSIAPGLVSVLSAAYSVKWANSGGEIKHTYAPGAYQIQRLRKELISRPDSTCCIDCPGSTLTLRITLNKNNTDKSKDRSKDKDKKKDSPSAPTAASPEKEEVEEAVVAALRAMKLLFVPVFSLQSCLAMEETRPVLQQLTQMYVPNRATGGLEADLALVRHIDSVNSAKNYSMHDAKKKGWSHYPPSEEDLIRLPALKVKQLRFFIFDKQLSQPGLVTFSSFYYLWYLFHTIVAERSRLPIVHFKRGPDQILPRTGNYYCCCCCDG